MRFSVVVPVYNAGLYLRQCLDSILQQTYTDYEIICIDDGSTDNSLEILREYADRNLGIKVIAQEHDCVGEARNKGIQLAKGEYIVFIDSDDWLETNMLETLDRNLDGEDMLCFNGRRYFEDKKVYEEADNLTEVKHIKGWDYYNGSALMAHHFAFVCVVLRVYRRAFLEEYHLRFQPKIYHEDNYFTPQACYYAKDVSVIKDVFYNYRVHKSSIMTTQRTKHREDLLWVTNHLAQFFVEKTDIDKLTIYRSLTHHYQVAFHNSNRKEDKELYPLVDWKLYKKVSRTKMRHRLQYWLVRMNPQLFRMINK